MNYADEIRRQVEAAPRAALPAVTAALWRAYSEEKVTEAEAEALSGLIEARQTKSETGFALPRSGVLAQSGDRSTDVGKSDTASDRIGSPRRTVGSRPRTDALRWSAVAAGRPLGGIPPAIARPVYAGRAGGALALVAAEVARRKDCRLSIENMAAVTGVCRSTVKNAIREATPDRPADRRGASDHRLPQRHQRAAHRLAGMAGVAAADPEGECCLAYPYSREGSSRPHLPRGRGQKRDQHAY